MHPETLSGRIISKLFRKISAGTLSKMASSSNFFPHIAIARVRVTLMNCTRGAKILKADMNTGNLHVRMKID